MQPLSAPDQFHRFAFFCILVLDLVAVKSLAFAFFCIAFSALLICRQQTSLCSLHAPVLPGITSVDWLEGAHRHLSRQ